MGSTFDLGTTLLTLRMMSSYAKNQDSMRNVQAKPCRSLMGRERPSKQQHLGSQLVTSYPRNSWNHCRQLSAEVPEQIHTCLLVNLPPAMATTPRFTSGVAMTASSAAMTKSQLSTISVPPPQAPPFRAAIIGLQEDCRREIDPNPFTCSSASLHSLSGVFSEWARWFQLYDTFSIRYTGVFIDDGRSTYAMRSAPAQKALPSPVTITTLCEIQKAGNEVALLTYNRLGSLSNQSNTLPMFSVIVGVIAFSERGQLNVRSMTWLVGNETLISSECEGT